MRKRYLEIGKIVGTHGLKGEMRVEPWCDTPAFFCMFQTLYLQEGGKKLSVCSRAHKRMAIMKAEGIDTMEQADLMRGKVLYMDRNDVALEEDVYFIQDIIGLRVLDVDSGKEYGVITDVFKTGANDVYQVTDNEKKEFLLPVIDQIIKKTDIEGGVVLIKPMKGLFEDAD